MRFFDRILAARQAEANRKVAQILGGYEAASLTALGHTQGTSRGVGRGSDRR